MYRRSSQLKSQLMYTALRPILITNHEPPYPKFVRIKMISLPIKYAVLPPPPPPPLQEGGAFRQKIYIHVLHLDLQS